MLGMIMSDKMGKENFLVSSYELGSKKYRMKQPLEESISKNNQISGAAERILKSKISPAVIVHNQ